MFSVTPAANDFQTDLQEEREKKEMEWLDRTTKGLLFPSKRKSPPSRAHCRRIHMLMKAWAARRTEGAPIVVEQLFHHLQQHSESSLTTQSYNLRLEAWSGLKDPKATVKCEAILADLKAHDSQTVHPNVHSYNACVKVWIRTATPEGLARADELIREMQQIYQQSEDIMMAPNRRSYNLLLYGLAHSNNANVTERAWEIYQHMLDSQESFSQPNGNTFHQLILCLTKDHQSKGFENRLEETFQSFLVQSEERDIEISADTFNVYMSGWMKSKQPTVGLKHILSALATMERLHEDDHAPTTPNHVTMNTVLAAYVKFRGYDALDQVLKLRCRLEKTYSIVADTTTFNTLIDAHAKSRRPTATKSAITILQTMEKNLMHGKKRSKPDCYTYCAVIDCLAKSQEHDAGVQSQEILRRMVELHQTRGGVVPSLAVYNSVLNAMAASSPVVLDEVQALLGQMENSSKACVLPKPNILTYNTAFKAALRSGSVDGAEWADRLLATLEDRARLSGSFRPDSFSYTTVIAAYGRSTHSQKAVKAAQLVERSIYAYQSGRLAGVPDVSVFNAACNACSFVKGDETERVHAFSTMAAISSLLTNFTQPDETTYGTLLRGCSQLLLRGDIQQLPVVRQIFQRACEDGLCGTFVLKQMKFAATPQLYSELLRCNLREHISVEDIPHEWRRNTKDATRRKRGFLGGGQTR